MPQPRNRAGSTKSPQRGREPEGEDYGREKGGIVECPTCHSVHYKKGWHASIDDLRHEVEQEKLFIAKKALCPACNMIQEKEFEGELLIEGVPDRLKEEMLNLVHNFGERAKSIDPQHRIIQIEETKKGFRVTTTENQLAVRLGKKLKDAHNTIEVHISHSREPNEVSRVNVTYVGTDETF